MGVSTRHMRHAAPVVAPGTRILTLVASFVIAKVKNINVGSSASRIPTLLGFISPFVDWAARACTTIDIISTIGLLILLRLAFFSTASYPSLHNNAAYWFFLLEIMAIFLNTYVYKLVKSAMVPDVTARAIPVTCDCLERNLGKSYCSEAMRFDGFCTRLWNYEDDYTGTQMRAGAQLACILTLVGYSSSFLTHHVEVLSKDQDRVATFEASTGTQTTYNAHFCAIPLLMSPNRPSEISESTDFIYTTSSS
ncbi:hypothetical protein PHMEG_0007541 [Phytophthora megakarya]|uniref:Uncharacterized protein n=1 Tax=Phytophthora megakarya TaxID=4795 RepID=A0A225WKX1_9STRA|nr:hypothetical protein PHMEG_0007541 [Phytophthora megakarya]